MHHKVASCRQGTKNFSFSVTKNMDSLVIWLGLYHSHEDKGHPPAITYPLTLSQYLLPKRMEKRKKNEKEQGK